MTVCLTTIPAFASTNLENKAEKAEKALVNAAEYYGWTAEEIGRSNSGNKSIINVNLHNSKQIFKNVRVVATDTKVTYRFKGKNYTLKGWKIGLKKHAISADKKAVVVNKAKTAADKLKSYAKKRKWTAKEVSHSYKNGKAIRVIRVKNEMFSKKITVITQRKDGKVALSYKLGGNKSSAKAIKKWLRTKMTGVAFGVGNVTVEGGGVPPAPTSGDDIVPDSDSESLETNPDFSGENAKSDTGLTGEPVPTP